MRPKAGAPVSSRNAGLLKGVDSNAVYAGRISSQRLGGPDSGTALRSKTALRCFDSEGPAAFLLPPLLLKAGTHVLAVH